MPFFPGTDGGRNLIHYPLDSYQSGLNNERITTVAFSLVIPLRKKYCGWGEDDWLGNRQSGG
jgi:hypothetical protein